MWIAINNKRGRRHGDRKGWDEVFPERIYSRVYFPLNLSELTLGGYLDTELRQIALSLKWLRSEEWFRTN